MRTIIVLGLLFMVSCSPAKDGNLEKILPEVFTFGTSHSSSGEPYLTGDTNSGVYLSWIEKTDSLSQLMYSTWKDSSWTTPRLIASGRDWFVNWADYPQIAAFSNGTLAAFFLKKNGSGTFAYEIQMTLSKDGIAWTEPWTLHDDATETEHGFVSMKPWGENLLISWLDGRNTAGSGTTHDHHGHHGQMSLRAALISPEGQKIDEWELDDRVCDCCQTAVTVTSTGPVVVFRDRSEGEIRDLGIVRWENGEWLQTQAVFMDLWQIQACPVNGPRVDALGNEVGIAWYTGSNNRPEVKVVFSNDGGKTFTPPIKVDLGNTIGRVDFTFLSPGEGYVTWMEEGEIYGRSVRNNGKMGAPELIAASSAKRSSGFPQLHSNTQNKFVSWTADTLQQGKVYVKKFAH
jgi:hypothetical protein